ncbi:MAG TPA: TonB-dependent receptor [Sphingobium sp.]|uniref:TonB-dependent receptor plug domain-containing protein n=1 Tax=Sphingobium sp. TaxID=1912891 RepID=UPI002ED2E82B
MRHFLSLSVAALAILPAGVQAQDKAAPDADQRQGDNITIVVTATPFDHGLDDTPAIAAKVDADQIRRSGGASIADALKDVPGVSATGFATGASRPIIRGMDSTRVRLLEDGTSSSDVSDIGPDHGIPIDPLAARSIEVVRGAGTLRYGSQAIGGVVNAINNRVPMTLPDQPIAAELTGAYGSAGDTWETSALTDVRMGNLAVHADGFYRNAGDYDTPLGTQQNSFFRGNGASLGGSYFLGDGKSHVGAAITQYDAKYGIPSDSTYIDMRQTKVMTRSSFALDSGLLKTFNVDGSYADYTHDEKEPEGTIDTTFRNKEYNARAELLLNAIGFVRNSAVGFEYGHRDFSAIGVDGSYLFPATTESFAGYIFTEMDLTNRLHLEASGRVESVHVQGTPASNIFTSNTYTPISGALGALYTATDGVKLGLTFSSTGRAPAMTELFARGGHDGPNTYETGDPNLRIERANSLEASLRIHRGRFKFDGSIYSSWFQNYIYGDLTGRTCDDDGVCAVGGSGDLKELFYRQQGAHFRGLEGEARYDLVKDAAGTLTAKLLGDYTRATLDDGNNVPRIPPYKIGGGLSWEGKKADAGVTFIHYGRQNDYGLFDTPTPGYNSLSAQIALRPFTAYPGVELAVVGQNLTNDVQRLATSLNKDDVVMPGRSVRVVLKLATF